MNLDALLRIKADVVGEQNIQRLGNSMKGLQGNVQNAALSMKALGAAVAGSAVVAGFTGIIKKATEAGDQLFALQQKTGISAQALTGIGNAAKLADVDMEILGKGLTKLNIALAGAGAGNKEAAQKFAGLGVSIKDVTGKILPADEVLKKLADRFADMPDGAGKAAAAVALFGKAGTALIPLLNEGSKSMEQFTYKISDDFAARSDLFNDSITTMGIKANGFGLELTDAMLPALQSILNEFSKLFDSKNDWTALFEVIKVGLRSIATVIYATIKLVDQLAKVAIYSFNAIDKALKGDYAGAGKALSKGFTSGIGQAQEDFKAIQRMWTDAPSPGNGRRTGGAAADLSAMGVSGAAAAQPFKLSSRGQALVAAAKKLGVSPLDLATIIDFETGGAYNPSMMGGAGGNYMGLIQFGAPERQQYGAYKGQSFEEQVQGPVVRYLKDRFASVNKSTEGASLLSLYRTVLGGNPKANINAQDAFGTSPASGVARMGANRRRALDTFFGGTIANVPYGATEAGGNAAQRFEAEAKITEERTKQLRAAQQASRSAANELEILQTISPIKKIQVEYDQKRGQLINEYNDKIKQSKSDEESSYYLGERSVRLAILEVQEKSALKNVQDELLQQDRERLKLIEEFTKIIEERLTRTSISAGFKQGLDQYIEQIGTLRDSVSGMTTQAFKGLEDQLAALATTGKANFADFAQSIIADMSRIVIQQTIMRPLLSALGGLFPSPSAAGGLGSFGFTIPSLMANGGIMTSMGAMPLRTYAGGGIASSPQMALFGEGSMNEAYVPLPDGRRIPVAMQGGGGGTSVVVNVDAKGTSVQGNGGRGDQLGKVLSAAVQAELIKQRRPGGLLA